MSDATALSRADLARLGREYLLAGHLQDRGSIPALLRNHTMDEANDIAIEEWMTASPVYAGRIRRAMRIDGDDVAAIFKALQFDIGFPHQFMDVGYELFDDGHGEFWLRSCGALADVMPMGEAFVIGMCHHIEDPTFDATAAATNPRARVRPIHRPPGVPDGGPDCRWTVAIAADNEPLAPHPRLVDLERSVLAGLPIQQTDDARPFDPDFELEDLSHAALLVATREFAIQGHLLARSCMLAVDRHYGRDEAIAVGRALFGGIAWIASERMAAAFGGDLAKTLRLTHLLTLEAYVGIDVVATDDGCVVSLRDDALAFEEGDDYSLAGLLRLGADEIVEALVHGAAPTARVEVTTPGREWTVTADADEPAPEPTFVRVMRFSGGPATVLVSRRAPSER